LYQVTPRDWPKYFGFGPAWMALDGAVKRMPSAEATSPAPQILTSGSVAWADTIRALAAAMGSGRMKFWRPGSKQGNTCNAESPRLGRLCRFSV
jgi:hypothetical protein